MKIYIGSDHAGFELKNKLVEVLKAAGHEVEDKGAFTLDPQDDYPDFVKPVAEAVAKDPEARGIVLGGSSQGEAIAANKVKGVRAAMWYGGNLGMIKLSRDHNDTNILSLGTRFLSEVEAIEAVTIWLATPFSGDERHVRRIQKLEL